MTVLERIAYFQNRRDEVPNQDLAKELAESADAAGLQEIAGHLWDQNSNIRSDCLKVLYEAGYLRPDLIVPFTSDFLKLIRDKQNRLVWGGMIALACVAPYRPEEIWVRIDDVIAAVEEGSVITVVWGIRVLAQVAAANPAYFEKIFPLLLKQLRTCIPRDVPLHAESILVALNAANQAEFQAAIEARRGELSPAQAARLKKVLKGVNS